MQREYIYFLDSGPYSLQYTSYKRITPSNPGIMMQLHVSTSHTLHNIYGPAITHYSNNKVACINYIVHDKKHNECGLAVVYFKDDTITQKQYYIKNMLHRDRKPAIIYYAQGIVWKKEYFTHGRPTGYKLSRK